MINWKTTVAGILTILLPIIIQLLGGDPAAMTLGAVIPAGAGLALAKDASQH